jgi:hypothetical protein
MDEVPRGVVDHPRNSPHLHHLGLGVILFKAAGDAEMASKGAATRMTDYLQKLNRYFLIQGILSLIMIIIGLVLVFVAGMAFFAGMLGHM